MARERQVTRTINVTDITAICMDIETMETLEKTLVITGDSLTNDQALKQAKKAYETETFKVVAIKAMETREELYGMTEIEFLKYARRLDNETRKPLEQ